MSLDSMEDEDSVRPVADGPLRRGSPRSQPSNRDKKPAILWVARVLFLVAAWVGPACAQGDIPLEYRVKATFLYNFSKFVDWPAVSFSEDNQDLVIAIVGDDPFGTTLDGIAADETSHGRKLIIKRLKWNENLRNCHVLFVSRSEKKHLQDILSNVDGAGILTVSEMEGFASSGGMIEFVFEAGRIRFDINREPAMRGNLKISAHLLVLARTVR
jgi:hypothetical protein